MIILERPLSLILILTMLFLFQNCQNKSLVVKKDPFGKLPDGNIADLYTLKNQNNVTVKITNYGGIVVSAVVPDKNGKLKDIVVGYDSLSKYLDQSPYFGAIVGRYANRIDRGQFTLNGKEYSLKTNDGLNHLHGGLKGFDKVLWDAKKIDTPNNVGVRLTYLSEDGEEGYPGNLKVTVEYTLNNKNELKIKYKASTDRKTIVNLTNHTYWNLSAPGTILNHKLMINADKFTPVNSTLIPTGELKNVEDTPMDFTEPKMIGRDIYSDYRHLKYGNNGYDHNWVLNKNDKNKPTLAARVQDPESGRILEFFTTEPGIQFYSGNFLDGSIIDKHGARLWKHQALVLECQHFPDSPNQPNFPSTILKPEDTYNQTTIVKFSHE